MNRLKLGIVGHGFVGRATEQGFNKHAKKFIVDPKHNTSIESLANFEPEIVFICVPTPMANDGSQDLSIILKVINELQHYCPESIKVVKSTVLPSALEQLEMIDSKIVYNPEFLREKHAAADFVNSEIIIFGGEKKLCKKVAHIYKEFSKCKTNQYIFTDIQSASLIKYAVNTYLASKVIFFNELHSLYKKLNTSENWEKIIHAISRDSRIGDSHMNVPGHDGRKGFGGACFPKDTLALAKYADTLSVDLSLLKNVIKINNRIRGSYKTLDSRETEQNVSYDDKL